MYEVAFAAAAAAVSGCHDLATAADWAQVFEAIASAIQQVGQAQPGDKTMLDAWGPAAVALRQSAQAGDALDSALARATAAAWKGVQDTTGLVPKRGRASLLGERARGHQDAGATSAYLIVKAIGDCARS
jgi:dihydroxyacetone kinase-like protein